MGLDVIAIPVYQPKPIVNVLNLELYVDPPQTPSWPQGDLWGEACLHNMICIN